MYAPDDKSSLRQPDGSRREHRKQEPPWRNDRRPSGGLTAPLAAKMPITKVSGVEKPIAIKTFGDFREDLAKAFKSRKAK